MNTHNRNINDPVYGFIRIDDPLVYKVLSHPYMQRLRRISQIGLSSLVYPGATHNRFMHSVGAMHLMGLAIGVLREKGFDISKEEASAAKVAILLHDVGHAPFSHTLEGEFLSGVQHEDISLEVMRQLRDQTKDPVFDIAIQIFEGSYHKLYLHSLISSQLDMDRLDYLNRDSFFTGASEGIVSHQRIIAMLNVSPSGDIVFEEKGLYSVEKFVIARRMMYWQVYLHKTVLGADILVNGVIQRAKEVLEQGGNIFAPPNLLRLLNKKADKQTLDREFINIYLSIDESDLWSVFKVWATHEDFILSTLARRIAERKLFFVKLLCEPIPQTKIDEISTAIIRHYNISEDQLKYLFTYKPIINHVYRPQEDNIKIMEKDGSVRKLTEVSEQINFTSDRTETKYFVAFPKRFREML